MFQDPDVPSSSSLRFAAIADNMLECGFWHNIVFYCFYCRCHNFLWGGGGQKVVGTYGTPAHCAQAILGFVSALSG